MLTSGGFIILFTSIFTFFFFGEIRNLTTLCLLNNNGFSLIMDIFHLLGIAVMSRELNFIKTTLKSSLDSQISLLPLGFSLQCHQLSLQCHQLSLQCHQLSSIGYMFLFILLRFLVTSGFSLASQSKTVTKGEDARRENPKGNKEIWESREMS